MRSVLQVADLLAINSASDTRGRTPFTACWIVTSSSMPRTIVYRHDRFLLIGTRIVSAIGEQVWQRIDLSPFRRRRPSQSAGAAAQRADTVVAVRLATIIRKVERYAVFSHSSASLSLASAHAKKLGRSGFSILTAVAWVALLAMALKLGIVRCRFAHLLRLEQVLKSTKHITIAFSSCRLVIDFVADGQERLRIIHTIDLHESGNLCLFFASTATATPSWAGTGCPSVTPDADADQLDASQTKSTCADAHKHPFRPLECHQDHRRLRSLPGAAQRLTTRRHCADSSARSVALGSHHRVLLVAWLKGFELARANPRAWTQRRASMRGGVGGGHPRRAEAGGRWSRYRCTVESAWLCLKTLVQQRPRGKVPPPLLSNIPWQEDRGTHSYGCRTCYCLSYCLKTLLQQTGRGGTHSIWPGNLLLLERNLLLLTNISPADRTRGQTFHMAAGNLLLLELLLDKHFSSRQDEGQTFHMAAGNLLLLER